jgi:hypothetical protein
MLKEWRIVFFIGTVFFLVQIYHQNAVREQLMVLSESVMQFEKTSGGEFQNLKNIVRNLPQSHSQNTPVPVSPPPESKKC